jgi:hypothetical protein
VRSRTLDGSSILYGTTSEGGNDMFTMLSGRGVVYALTPPVTTGLWQEKVIRSFCAACGDGCSTCSDGIQPAYDFVVDASANIWGTTANGGSNAKGTAWELTPGADPWSDPWTETILYNSCWANGAKCPDGWVPNGVTMDASGHLFGTTFEGGNGFPAFGGNVFNYDTGTSTYSTVYNFCPTAGCSDGGEPETGIILDNSGDYRGVTLTGGVANQGVIFEVVP